MVGGTADNGFGTALLYPALAAATGASTAQRASTT